MFQKSGYMQVSNSPACDPSDRKYRIIEISVPGGLFAIRTDELTKVLNYGRKATIWQLTHHFGKHLGERVGEASLSYSRKGLVIEIFPGKKHMLSTNSALNLLNGYTKYSPVPIIPRSPEELINPYGNPTVQSSITPWVAV